MRELIDKTALVAEIKRRLKGLEDCHADGIAGYAGEISGLKRLLSFLDTLEVKEVDLEKEFDNYTKDILACDIQFEPFTHLHNCAKHFFELGLKAKGE